ncbi:MAG TPA: transposase [Methylococcus sp.]|nr:transposase [Methylococcus sp.]
MNPVGLIFSIADSVRWGNGNRESRCKEKIVSPIAKARIRAKVEHPPQVIKRQFGFVKVRYRGLAKNTANLMALFALANLLLVRKRLLSMGA